MDPGTPRWTPGLPPMAPFFRFRFVPVLFPVAFFSSTCNHFRHFTQMSFHLPSCSLDYFQLFLVTLASPGPGASSELDNKRVLSCDVETGSEQLSSE